MKEIILASASPRRAGLLKQIGLEFKTVPPDIEENIGLDLNPEELAMRLSFEKGMSIARKMSRDAIVISADTIVVKNGILGKPEDRIQAFKMLKSLQGEWHEVITGITAIDVLSLKYIKDYESTRVKIRKMSDVMIESYINTGEPFDKAGAYGAQEMGAVLVERIEGCYFNVVGLPLLKLSVLLEDFGIRVLI